MSKDDKDDKKTLEWKLTPVGDDMAKNGSYKYRILKLASETSLPLSSVVHGDLPLCVGIAQALKAGWIQIEK